MQTEAFFYCMLSISGLAGALFMYWNIMLEYHRSRLKPLTAKIVISLFLLGIGLGIFNHFLSLTLRNVTDEVNWIVRIISVLLMGGSAWFIYRQSKAAVVAKP